MLYCIRSYIFENHDVHYEQYNIRFCVGGGALYLAVIDLYSVCVIVYVFIYLLSRYIYIHRLVDLFYISSLRRRSPLS
jgi:hypothetical protein